MAIKVTFTLSGPLGAEGEISTQLIDYSVTEDSTPLSAGDSSGSVGTFSATLPRDAGAFVSAPRSFRTLLATVGPTIFEGSEIRLTDSRKGYTLGNVTGVTESRDGATITLTGVSRLGKLSVYGIQAQPFVGTLRNAFLYYAALAGVTTDVFVDDEIAGRPVVFQGWHGELWYSMKQMAAAQDCDLSLVSGVILLRAIRKREATQNRETSRSIATGGGTLAQAVEIYRYNNRAVTDELVYPPGGWNEEVEVMNVNAGENAEYTLPLSASITTFQSPVMQTHVAPDYSASSVYTIVADDGLPVPPGLWDAYGGSLTVEISPDTRNLLVTLRGPVGTPLASGAAATNFSVALGSDVTGNRYSTFRVVGTGVAFDKTKVTIRTGVPASATATEVGVTIDNPFISTVDELYRTGTRAARLYAGASMSLSGQVISINKRGDTGQAQYPTYGSVRDEVIGRLGAGTTYADEQIIYPPGATYGSVRDYWFDFFRDDDVDQVFGNAQGARVFDKKSRRWYRIRSATPTPAGISIQADDDLLYGDHVAFYQGRTYGDLVALNSNLTYMQSELAGLHS